MSGVPGILSNAYLQGGVVLLFIAVLALAVVGLCWFAVRPLWNDLKASRDRERQMIEKVAVMGEAGRATNESTTKALEVVSRELTAAGIRIEELMRSTSAYHDAAQSQRAEILARIRR